MKNIIALNLVLLLILSCAGTSEGGSTHLEKEDHPEERKSNDYNYQNEPTGKMPTDLVSFKKECIEIGKKIGLSIKEVALSLTNNPDKQNEFLEIVSSFESETRDEMCNIHFQKIQNFIKMNKNILKTSMDETNIDKAIYNIDRFFWLTKWEVDNQWIHNT